LCDADHSVSWCGPRKMCWLGCVCAGPNYSAGMGICSEKLLPIYSNGGGNGRPLGEVVKPWLGAPPLYVSKTLRMLFSTQSKVIKSNKPGIATNTAAAKTFPDRGGGGYLGRVLPAEVANVSPLARRLSGRSAAGQFLIGAPMNSDGRYILKELGSVKCIHAGSTFSRTDSCVVAANSDCRAVSEW
jgi:hypothetical protein